MSHWKQYLAPAAIIALCPVDVYAVQYLSVEEAQKLCYSPTASFTAAPIIYTPEQIAKIESLTGQKVQTKGEQMWKVMDGDKLLGYFFVDYVIGKHLVIDYAVALTADGAVKQVEILQYRESYGGEIRNRSWLNQFAGKTVDAKLKLNDDIVNIGGATLSCRHVSEGIKRVLATFQVTVQPQT